MLGNSVVQSLGHCTRVVERIPWFAHSRVTHMPIRRLLPTQLDSLLMVTVNTGTCTISLLGNIVVQSMGCFTEVAEWSGYRDSLPHSHADKEVVTPKEDRDPSRLASDGDCQYRYIHYIYDRKQCCSECRLALQTHMPNWRLLPPMTARYPTWLASDGDCQNRYVHNIYDGKQCHLSYTSLFTSPTLPVWSLCGVVSLFQLCSPIEEQFCLAMHQIVRSCSHTRMVPKWNMSLWVQICYGRLPAGFLVRNGRGNPFLIRFELIISGYCSLAALACLQLNPANDLPQKHKATHWWRVFDHGTKISTHDDAPCMTCKLRTHSGRYK